jgi:SAM-dependent methyltransferase
MASQPAHMRRIDEPEVWRLELRRPNRCNKCVLEINLVFYCQASERLIPVGHWGYILDAADQAYMIEYEHCAHDLELRLNGRKIITHQRQWETVSENGFCFWTIRWTETDTKEQAQVQRGQVLLFRAEDDETILLLKCWPDANRREPSKDDMARQILIRLREEMISLAAGLNPSARVLDLGCGDKPYYPYFHGHCSEFVGVDLRASLLVDLVYDGSVNLSDEYFDLIICTQVLEHTRDPFKLSSEIWRLLKRGGRAFVSVPFTWHYHPWPKDYWRFTSDGLEVLFERFAECRIDRDCDTVHTVLHELGFLLIRTGYARAPLLRLLNRLGRLSRVFPDSKLPGHHLAWLVK